MRVIARHLRVCFACILREESDTAGARASFALTTLRVCLDILRAAGIDVLNTLRALPFHVHYGLRSARSLRDDRCSKVTLRARGYSELRVRPSNNCGLSACMTCCGYLRDRPLREYTTGTACLVTLRA